MVIDSPPGFGKTMMAIQQINQTTDEIKFLFITPFLSEVKRVINSCPEKHFVQPNAGEHGGSKSKHLIDLISQGRNVVSTHALFAIISDDLIELLRLNNYVLYLDEVFDAVGNYSISNGSWEQNEAITKNDIQSLIVRGYIQVEDDYSVTWIDQEHTLSKYGEIKELADRSCLFFVNDSYLLWTFPIKVFREGIFDQIYILTYRFDSQIQALYYDFFDIQYVKYSVFKNEEGLYQIEPFNLNKELVWKKEIKDKIHIIQNEKLNRIGDVYQDERNHPYKSALSISWFRKNTKRSGNKVLNILGNNVVNFYQNYTSVKTELRMWTCFKDFVSSINNKNLSTKCFIPINARSTNEYKDKTAIAYPVNRYTNPFINSFFQKKDIYVDQDQWALTELVQWLWRSAIRNGEEIILYIPSERMRTLLAKFLNNEEIEF